jgi:hypothetical protein
MASSFKDTFSDKAGFRACLDTKPFVEKKTAGDTAQAHLIDEAKIRERCVARAVKVIASKGTPAMAGEFLQEAKKGGASADFYELIQAAVTKSSKLCNDRVVYDEMVKLYSYPGSSTEVHQDMANMAATIKTCLKDKDFSADFASDAQSDQQVKKNVCKHLAKEGIIQCN